MTIKPRIGVLFTTSGWFRDVGLQNDSLPLTQEVDTLARDIIERLLSFIEPIYHGVLYTVGDARKAAGKSVTQMLMASLSHRLCGAKTGLCGLL